jgi:uncharacterized protein YndB with AHSA1/START domain
VDLNPVCKIASFLTVLASAMPATAEVIDMGDNGFTVRHQFSIAAERSTVYETVTDQIGSWWSSDHTVSGNAANLYLTAVLAGCFCERLGEGGGLIHLSVTFVNPGVLLRLSGGLGPLGLMGVAGNMTWEFDETEDGTTVTLQYAVGGYLHGGLGAVASPVDAVLGEQMSRLKAYIETGSPEQG